MTCARCLLANETPEEVITIYEGRALCFRHWEMAVELMLTGSERPPGAMRERVFTITPSDYHTDHLARQLADALGEWSGEPTDAAASIAVVFRYWDHAEG